ncbi:MAG: dihydrolipoamide acetyltransferase family protein [Phycisphaerales bacterium]
MPITITMPRLSDTMQQGTIVKWNVKEGQKVKSGDVIADIETDKATMELQTFDDGTVAKLAVPQGQTVPVGTAIVILATAGEDVGAAARSAAAPAAKAAVAAGAKTAANPPAPTAAAIAVAEPAHGTEGNGRIFASPLAKKIAAESGVDLARLSGTGPSGRIVRADVEAAIRSGVPAPAAAARVTPAPLPAAAAALKGTIVPLSNMRRVIATRLVESKQTIPHYQVTVDVDMDPLMSLRSQLNDQLASQGVKLSVNDFLVRACALAMHQHPFVNSRWIDKGNEVAIEQLGEVNIGVAIALPAERGGGLVVATLRSADQIGLRQISAQSKQLSEKARTKGLAPNEMTDSTFTISNLGMFGVSNFTAIINPPNVAILAVGAAIEKPVVKNGQIVVGHVMSMTMSSDHRVVDGAMAAAYLATVRELLEKPASLLV